MRLIPSIDILNGKCVRLVKGNFSKVTIYGNQPVEFAKRLEDTGIKYLHMIDLDGAVKGTVVNHHTLNEIALRTNLSIEYGGGIQSTEDARKIFDCGATQIIGGTIAIKKPDIIAEWLGKFGKDRIILAADTKNGMIAVNAWRKTTETGLTELIQNFKKKGGRYVICTDIAKDGTLDGASNTLYKKLLSTININLIASGGISSISDLIELKKTGCDGAVFGKSIYENRITLKDLSRSVSDGLLNIGHTS